uniref:PhoD-like phosphatase metallophosphatase domain-containing protein n=1 Tax=Aegilops tauschii subsp. strangulata TaxID=200361 RepID=A0A453NZJ4_AEGTS
LARPNGRLPARSSLPSHPPRPLPPRRPQHHRRGVQDRIWLLRQPERAPARVGGHRGVRPAGLHLARGQRLRGQQAPVPGVREGAHGGALEERAALLPGDRGGAAREVRAGQGQPGVRQAEGEVFVIGTWDDHDYGVNDAGKEYSGKVFSQRLLLDFLDEDEDSPRRKQAGVYASYMFGPEGKRVKVIMLDTRYHRDPLLSDGAILGDPQWQWLERELRGPQSEMTIIGSSIQVVSNLSATTGPLFYVESWARFPRERERLFRLIDSSKRNGVLFISGDVHFGEIARFDCGAQYPLYDITSSGLTQSVENSVPAVFQSVMRLLAWLTPTPMRVFSPNCRHKSCSYGQPNFGAIEIDWNAVPPRVKIELRDLHGNSVDGVEFPISELKPSNAHANKKEGHSFEAHCSLETELPWLVRYRLALLFFGTIAVFVIAVALLVIACCSATKLFTRKCKMA